MMATPKELADTALALAQRCIATHQDALVTLADGDAIALTQAAQLVLLTNARTPERERTVEHLAFVLLTAAFGQVTRQRQDAFGTE
jgi:hypothetical protein